MPLAQNSMPSNAPQTTPETLPKIGVVYINLGTPEEPNAAALRPYLKQFLSDRRVVEIPRAVWLPILYGVILNTRPKQSAAKYKQIWTSDGSPLMVHSMRQTKMLQGYLGERVCAPVMVALGMRYGRPSIDQALEKLFEQGCEHILVLPAYPQYAGSSTASAFDSVFAWAKGRRNIPELRLVKHYSAHPTYIDALANQVREYWRSHGRPDKLIMSFHGVPQFTIDRGDPYHAHCETTGRLLAQALNLPTEQMRITYQSRFGRAQWLKPYTSATLEELGKQRVERVDVVCPGFVSDCLETLEEIAIEGKATFLEAGGKEFHYIPCLNENDDWIKALCAIAMEHLSGWTAESQQIAFRK